MKSPEFEAQPDFTIREMRLEDGEAVNSLLRELHVATYTNDELGVTPEKLAARFERYTPEERQERLRQRLDADDNQAYVAVGSNGEVIGMVAPKIEEGEVHRLGALYVRKEYHGKGVAGELMKKAFAWLGAENNQVELHVAAYNDRAKAFYRKWGFEEVPGSEALFDDLIPEVTMVRQPGGWND